MKGQLYTHLAISELNIREFTRITKRASYRYISVYIQHEIMNNNYVAVCLTDGIIVSYYNRPMFPEYCRDSGMDDRKTYNTMVRVAGSFTSVALAFEAVLFEYKWNLVVLLSDDAPGMGCTYSAKAIHSLVSVSVDWPTTIHWILMKTDASDQDLIDYLAEARIYSRGI